MPAAAAPSHWPSCCGYGATADAQPHHAARTGRCGGVRAARRALEKAGMAPADDRPRQRPRDLDAGGRSGRAGRRSARSSASTRRASAITATKGAIGHTLGAAGGDRARWRPSSAMREGCVPPTLNLSRPGAGSGRPRSARHWRPGSATVNTALVNAFGFGGQNSTLLSSPLVRHEQAGVRPPDLIVADRPAGGAPQRFRTVRARDRGRRHGARAAQARCAGSRRSRRVPQRRPRPASALRRLPPIDSAVAARAHHRAPDRTFLLGAFARRGAICA